MGAARSLGRHWLGTWFEAKQACGVGEMAHRYALVARTAKGNTAEPQQVGTWRMDGRARTHRRGFLLSNPLQTKMGMGTWLEACRVGEMASRQGSQCFTLPLRLPLSQSRGVGGSLKSMGGKKQDNIPVSHRNIPSSGISLISWSKEKCTSDCRLLIFVVRPVHVGHCL